MLADALARAGVPRLFTVAADARVAAAAAHAGIDVVSTGTVEAACIMAAVTGDVSGNVGAVVVDTEDHRRSARAALATALAERSPLVCFGPRDDGVAPGVKAIVDAGAASAAHWIAHAMHLARKSPRGPVYVTASDGFDARALPVATVVQPIDLPAPEASALDAAAAAIRAATHPVVVVGIDGRSDAASAWLRAFAESVPAPVLATWKGKGVLSDPHPLAFGVAGTTAPAASVLRRADLVIAVGVDDLERDTLGWSGAVVELGSTSAPGRAAVSVSGEAGTILAELAPRLRDTRADWDVAELDRWKRQLDVRRSADGLTRLVGFVREAMPAGTMAAFDSSLRDGAVAWDCVAPEDLHVLARSDLGGFGVPAATAAALARPSAVAVAFTDPAGLAVSREAVLTAGRVGAPVGIIVTGRDPCGPERVEGVPLVEAASEPALAVALSRLLTARRPIVVDATGMRSIPPV